MAEVFSHTSSGSVPSSTSMPTAAGVEKPLVQGDSVSTVANAGASRVATADVKKDNSPGLQRQSVEKSAPREQISKELERAVKDNEMAGRDLAAHPVRNRIRGRPETDAQVFCRRRWDYDA